MRWTAALAALAGAAWIVAPAGGATKHAPIAKKVTVRDDYYLPVKLTVARGTSIKWVWPYDNADTHDVKLQKGPKGAKRFWSQPAAASFSFTRKLTVPGTYRIVCTLHQHMTMTIVVRK